MLNRFSNDKIEAGVDEAGRGCLAGPVCVAAVILPKDVEVPEGIVIRDSKKMTEKQRTRAAEWIRETATDHSVYFVSVDVIDRINILQASLWGMTQAVVGLNVRPELLLIDGPYYQPADSTEYRCFPKGDNMYLSIAAASILAKTTRDALMKELHKEYPDYGWDKNKAYGTRVHKDAILQYGLTPHHRRSFKISY